MNPCPCFTHISPLPQSSLASGRTLPCASVGYCFLTGNAALIDSVLLQRFWFFIIRNQSGGIFHPWAAVELSSFCQPHLPGAGGCRLVAAPSTHVLCVERPFAIRSGVISCHVAGWSPKSDASFKPVVHGNCNPASQEENHPMPKFPGNFLRSLIVFAESGAPLSPAPQQEGTRGSMSRAAALGASVLTAPLLRGGRI